MRKILDQKFWSHGTPLGSLGPLSFEALGPGASQCQILLIWGPYECLDLAALQVQAEILKPIRTWCGPQNAIENMLGIRADLVGKHACSW